MWDPAERSVGAWTPIPLNTLRYAQAGRAGVERQRETEANGNKDAQGGGLHLVGMVVGEHFVATVAEARACGVAGGLAALKEHVEGGEREEGGRGVRRRGCACAQLAAVVDADVLVGARRGHQPGARLHHSPRRLVLRLVQRLVLQGILEALYIL